MPVSGAKQVTYMLKNVRRLCDLLCIYCTPTVCTTVHYSTRPLLCDPCDP
jgi:hypothetical protein